MLLLSLCSCHARRAGNRRWGSVISCWHDMQMMIPRERSSDMSERIIRYPTRAAPVVVSHLIKMPHAPCPGPPGFPNKVAQAFKNIATAELRSVDLHSYVCILALPPHVHWHSKQPLCHAIIFREIASRIRTLEGVVYTASLVVTWQIFPFFPPLKKSDFRSRSPSFCAIRPSTTTYYCHPLSFTPTYTFTTSHPHDPHHHPNEPTRCSEK